MAGSDRPTDRWHGSARVLVGLVVAMIGMVGHADGPRDNLPDQVRAIPPVGIELDEATAARLLAAAGSLERDAVGLSGVDDRLRAEAAVFGRAVRMAVEDRFFYAAKDVEQAENLLRVGRERISAIVGGAKGLAAIGVQDGRLEKPTAVVGGFRSRIDGSVQPYAVVLPAGFDARDPRPRRLDVWLHGRGEKVSEAAFLAQRSRDTGPVNPPDAIVLHPYGRYCNAFKFAGEIDVLEAIDHVTAILPIDADRVVMRGFSMGGAGCWQLAVHHPGRWMAATPGAGFSETREFLRGFQDEVFVPTDAQAALLNWYDCPGWANNLRTLPTTAYSGELDRQKQASDVMVAACRSRGFEIPHVVGPQMGHKIDPGSMVAIEDFLAGVAGKGRPAVPRAIDFTTYTLRYPRHTWLTIEGLGKHWNEARVRATIASPTAIEIETTNVTRLRLDIQTNSKAIAADGSVDVRIDGHAADGDSMTGSTSASANDRVCRARSTTPSSSRSCSSAHGSLPKAAPRSMRGCGTSSPVRSGSGGGISGARSWNGRPTPSRKTISRAETWCSSGRRNRIHSWRRCSRISPSAARPTTGSSRAIARRRPTPCRCSSSPIRSHRAGTSCSTAASRTASTPTSTTRGRSRCCPTGHS